MKSYLGYIAALCLLTPLSGVAQRTNVRAADRLLQSDKPNYTEIRRLIKLAEEHEETKNDSYTYYVKGLVERSLYRTVRSPRREAREIRPGCSAPSSTNSLVGVWPTP